jgi:aminopeptidase N
MSVPDQPSIRLADYRPPHWLVHSIELEFDLDFDATTVRARLALERNPTNPSDRIRLDGEGLELVSATLDGVPVTPVLDAAGIAFESQAMRCRIETVVRIRPEANTALSGLYRSGAALITQCEAEGFRRITYFPDRPDVMSRYSVTLRADRARFPVLLANGELEAEGELPGARHWARWLDPHPKPCYLFALVAGRLEHIAERFRTAEGREVALRIYTEPGAIARCRHAMQALIAAMRWDEQHYGRCYDLDRFNIVAVGDFNMGAMENKGLNIFNTRYIVADEATATDADFQHIEAVVAHEYFHNWTGNRVTCRDWFQLSLKEGLTVFRDQQFTAEMHSHSLTRIDDVRVLKSQQFTEDAGPFAHPVRPSSYAAIDNFYTATVYEKGAEIVRMLHTTLGAEGFRRGMDRYFERHDGEAVTCEDFVAALGAANGRDLSAFLRWYTQAGTPRLAIAERYDAARGELTLSITQHTPPTPGQSEKHALPIPLRLMAYREDGSVAAIRLRGEADVAAGERVLLVDRAEQEFVLVGFDAAPVLSLLQGFSAPVRLERALEPLQLGFLARHDRDPFNRWDACQRLAEQAVRAALRPESAEPDWLGALAAAGAAMLADPARDASLSAECLTLPEHAYLAEQLGADDPLALVTAREATERALGCALAPALLACWNELAAGSTGRSAAAIANRRLRNVALGLLLATDAEAYAEHVQQQFATAPTMTDRLAALTLLVHRGLPGADAALAAFERRHADDALVLDKWFAVQATDPRPGALAAVERLSTHAAFTWRNPNKVRALVSSFARLNPRNFHAADGGGYRFLAAAVARVDRLNPQLAARLAQVFEPWRKLDAGRRALIERELRQLGAGRLSPDTADIIARALA